MLIKNRYYMLLVVIVIAQQVALAASTFYIALAGYSLMDSDIISVRHEISLFFLFALLAYFLSSCGAILQVRLKNQEWKNYTLKIFSKFSHEQKYSSKRNQQDTLHWLTGEAPTTLEEGSRYLVELISVYTNVIFTLLVFSLTLGFVITTIVSVSILISVVCVTLSKKYIDKIADQIQKTKIMVYRMMNTLWSTHFYGNRALNKNSQDEFQTVTRQHFKACEYYAVIEQVIACLPIYFTVTMMIVAIYTNSLPIASLGAFVAVLPRTLQLLGNVHELSLSNSRFFLVLRKLKNLESFVERLQQSKLESQVQSDRITVTDLSNRSTLSSEQFFDNFKTNSLKHGRYQITGVNGSGKSSLLKLIKNMDSDAILITPDMSLLTLQENTLISSGEMQLKQLEHVFSIPTSMYLLDEWDANLDMHNTEKLNNFIDMKKEDTLIIEVRHLK